MKVKQYFFISFYLVSFLSFAQDCPSFNPEGTSNIYLLRFNFGGTSKVYVDYPETVTIDGIEYDKNPTTYGTIISYHSPSPDPTGSVDIDDFTVDFGFGESCHYVDKVLGSKEINSLKTVKIHPNPIKGKELLNIVFKESTNKSISFYNILGEMVYIVPKTSKQILEINLSDFSKGLYFIKIKNAKGVYTKKLIITH